MNIGRFVLTDDQLRDTPKSDLLSLFGKVIVLEAIHDIPKQCTFYTGLSREFNYTVNQGMDAPFYCVSCIEGGHPFAAL